jgi:bacterioferritin
MVLAAPYCMFPGPRRVAVIAALGGRVDKSDLIDRLNDDLATEFQSIVQYVQHAATVKGAEYGAIVAEMSRHVGQELQHAQTLAAQTDFLGGVPSGRVPAVPEALRPLLTQTQDHVIDLREALGR